MLQQSIMLMGCLMTLVASLPSLAGGMKVLSTDRGQNLPHWEGHAEIWEGLTLKVLHDFWP